MGQITAFNGEREPLHLISVFPFPLFRSSNKEKYRPLRCLSPRQTCVSRLFAPILIANRINFHDLVRDVNARMTNDEYCISADHLPRYETNIFLRYRFPLLFPSSRDFQNPQLYIFSISFELGQRTSRNLTSSFNHLPPRLRVIINEIE